MIEISATKKVNVPVNKKDFKKILKVYLKQYRPDVDITKLKYVASGWCARVYRYGDKVFKITTDYEDFFAAKKLMRKQMSSFAEVYSAEFIKYEDRNLFILEVEYCGQTMIDKNEWVREVFNATNDCFHDRFEGYKKRIPSYQRILRRLEYDWNDIKEKDIEYIKMVHGLFKTLYYECKRLKIQSFDYHRGNITFNHGKFKVIDFGYSAQRDYSNRISKIKYKTICETQP